MSPLFTDKTVLVTGGTGSFGQAFVRHLLQTYNPRRVIVFSRDELKQSEQRAAVNDSRVRWFLGDVRDRERLLLALKNVDVVIHAAALKQVPAGEYDPTEFVNTNVKGTENVARACIDSGVDRAVFLSTDKACNPINLYGATKLCAEKLWLASEAYAGEYGTRFAVTRYGNVAGSRGSVVPAFRRMAAQSETLTLTHTSMTRYWMRLEQAVELVDRAVQTMEGGEIFIPRLPSFRVRDLATAIQPEGDFRFIGIRPGEKLHETLLGEDESRNATSEEWGFTVRPGSPTMEEGKAYTSGGNDVWLGVEELKVELGKV